MIHALDMIANFVDGVFDFLCFVFVLAWIFGYIEVKIKIKGK